MDPFLCLETYLAEHQPSTSSAPSAATGGVTDPFLCLEAYLAEHQPPTSSAATGGVMDPFLCLEAYLAEHQPPTTSAPSAATGASKAQAPAPRTVGARSSKYTIKLHEKYQALGIPKPDFDFDGDGKGWCGTVTIRGLLRKGEEDGKDLVLKEYTLYGTKQEAKEKLSEKALEVIEELERNGTLAAEVHKAGKRERERVVNYIGQLLEFQRSIDSPLPTYIDYECGNRFSCEVTIDGYPKPFGSKETYFSTKKAARQDAARHVVEHFKAAGEWPDTSSDVGGIKKRKVTQPLPPPKIRSSSSAGTDASAAAEFPGGDSFPQQVATLATQLGLNCPSWNMIESDSARGFYSVTCSFKHGGALEGPLGEVRHIYGKKRAKEECARLTLEYLRHEKERRMDYGRMMMEDVVGGEGVANVAVGQPIGGSEEVGRAVVKREKELDESDENGGGVNVAVEQPIGGSEEAERAIVKREKERDESDENEDGASVAVGQPGGDSNEVDLANETNWIKLMRMMGVTAKT